jgi:NADH-quinone oxidoreductase subunit L
MMQVLTGTGEVLHPLNGSAAELIWLLPLIPLLGFILNGLLSIVPAWKAGPPDPGAAGHDHDADRDADHDADAMHDSHAARDEHGPQRHRFAALTSIIGPGVLLVTFSVALVIFGAMLAAGEIRTPFVRDYYSWMVAGDLSVGAALQLDQLSMVMVLVITGVGALIHIFSVGYMREDPGYPRYFAYLNLFVFFMLVLVLGASFPVMFVGWEGVGLCSYLLIGFWFSDKVNADAGKKAFIVNRIGDFGFLVAMMLIFANLGSLDFATLSQSTESLQVGGALVTAICLFLFLGCTGKSAQIPLYTWLPDAMAGPTPVSALIHAATMVTAGVYLVARSSFFFALSPVASLVVALVGGVTAAFAATIGLKQWDIKRVLAYSTVSQLGYMFIAVGIGAYVAGIFHLVTHAFFKALLFLGSGSVIYAMHAAYHRTHRHDDAQDMRNMGGLRHHMPVTWVLMWIATLAIAGIPLFAGFFSKDAILASVLARAGHSTLADASLLGVDGSTWLALIFVLGLFAALMTAVYMTRLMLYTFHGPNRTGEQERPHLREAPWIMTAPLVLLAILSALAGWLNIPETMSMLGAPGILHQWLDPVVGEASLLLAGGTGTHLEPSTEHVLLAVAILLAVGGIIFAWLRLKPRNLVSRVESPAESGFGLVLLNKYYVDEIYDKVIVRPFIGVSRVILWKIVDIGIVDGLVNLSALLSRGFGYLGGRLQSGQVGTYAWVLVLGALALLAAVTLG